MPNCALALDFQALLFSSYSADINFIFRRVRKIAQSDYEIRHVCLSVRNPAPTGRIFTKFDI